MLNQKVKELREFARNFKEIERERLLTMLFMEIGFRPAFSIGVKQLKGYLPIFEEEEPEVSWVTQLIQRWEQQEPIETLSSLTRYEEVTDWDNTMYLQAIELFDNAYFESRNGDQEKAIQLLVDAIVVFTRAMRYQFWSIKQEQLVQFWNLPEDDLNGILARLSYARDPIVNDYVRDIWYSIADDIDATLASLNLR